MNPLKRLSSWIAAVTVQQTLAAAIVCALASLGCMVTQTLLPIPLLLVVGMGVSHGLGLLGVVLFGVSILKEVLALPNGAADSGKEAGERAKSASSSSHQGSEGR